MLNCSSPFARADGIWQACKLLQRLHPDKDESVQAVFNAFADRYLETDLAVLLRLQSAGSSMQRAIELGQGLDSIQYTCKPPASPVSP